jgi:cytochrome c556
MRALTAIIGLALIMAGSADAAEPQDEIDYRQSIMTAVKGHNAAAQDIIRGKVAFSDYLPAHADAIVALFAELDHIFPEGSDFGETAALPAIWEKPEEFAKAVDKAQQAAQRFADAAASGDPFDIEETHRQLGDACKGCHREFRKKKE